MNIDPEHDFTHLKKLLALKRLEQPPLNYFVYLPSTIIHRLHQGEGEAGFWERFLGSFTLRPSLAYGFALAICGTLVAATGYAVKMGSPRLVSVRSPVEALHSSTPAMTAQWVQTPGRVLHVRNWMGNTNRELPPEPFRSLFQPVGATAIPASY